MTPALHLSDPEFSVDLFREKRKSSALSTLFSKATEYLENVVETAVDDQRQDLVSHLFKAISVRDLREQDSMTCPENTPIPSEQWLRLQFTPKNPTSKASL